MRPRRARTRAVGVRTIELTGEDSNYTTEIWYPAADEYRGVEAIDTFKFVDEMPEASQEATREAKPSDKKFPLIVYWHGAYGHRREMAAMCVFLASHGFVVASADFPGDIDRRLSLTTRRWFEHRFVR